MNTEKPRVYVACLASYNAGILHGAWIDLDGTAGIEESIEEMLAESTIEDAEEWAIHDSENCGKLSEHVGISELQEIAEAFEQCECDSIDWEHFLKYCECEGLDIEHASVSNFEESFHGEWDSVVDYARGFLESSGELSEIPKHLQFYFDYESYARDLEIDSIYTIEHNGSFLVFSRQ